jgi:cation diffusion facilitator family transporter
MSPTSQDPASAIRRGVRATKVAIVINATLAAIKLVAGIVGHTYALIADAVESSTDVFGSMLVWAGLAVAGRPPDEDHPYGHGKAEALAGGAVALMLIGAAFGIAVEAAREIRTPHQLPAPWTLAVLVTVIIVKAILSRRIGAVGVSIGSTAVKTDAWHHLSDALTSAAAFIGISIALWGSCYRGGTGWESADDWAALGASAVIAFNGVLLLRPAIHDLMDRMPGEDVVEPLASAARAVPGVLAIEKLAVRKAGLGYRVTVHVQAAPGMSLRDSHLLGGRVKGAMQSAVPQVQSVLVHMEPYQPGVKPEPSSGVS